MEKYLSLIGLVVLTACNGPAQKPATFACATALGAVELQSEDPNLKILPNSLVVENEGKLFTISRALCVEIQEK